MSNVTPQYTPPADASTRPSTVTLASTLLYVLAGLYLIGLVVSVTTISGMQDVYREAYKGTPLADSADTILMSGIIVGVVIGLAFAVGYIVLGILNSKGKNPARIVTWVIAGLQLCCSAVSLVGNSLAGALNGSSAGGVDQAEIARKIADAQPAWLQPVELGLAGLELIAALLVIILLALPPSAAFFRKPEPVWVPPTSPVV